MTIDPNLGRWCFTSIAKYLGDACDDLDLPTVIEGYQDKDETFEQKTDRGEIRITGPYSKCYGASEHEIMFPVNIMVYSRYDGQKNAYTMMQFLSELLSIMDQPIPVFKYGTGEDDDPTKQIGCLRTDGAIFTWQFGEVSPQMKQAMIDTKFSGRFPDVN